MKVKAVLFDADGVIQEADPAFIDTLKALVPNRSDEFVTELFRVEATTATGAVDFRVALLSLLDKWGVTTNVDDVLRIWQNLSLIEGLFDLLSQLREQGFVVALTTNQQSYRMAYMRDELKLDDHFDRCFYSCEVGFKKPEAAYFEAVTESLNLSAQECLFIDDSQANVDAAAGVGLVAVRYKFRSLASAKAELCQIINS